jgi:hypothetical protein|tara:strand:- start:1001 stop:1372 length:372 start_codon:yes stop_codon:yes gene_type:complete
MGASEYMNIGKGRTAQEAFDRLVTSAQWEHGHGGYSGTIAEKRDFVEFKRPKGMRRATVLAMARGLGRIMHDDDGHPQANQSQTKYPQLPIAAMFKVWDDKWGPSLAIELSKGEYLFAGFASS